MKLVQHAVERWTSRSLKLGVWLSGAVMVVGLAMYAVLPSASPIPEHNPGLSELFSNVVHGSLDPFTMMYTGLVLLMLTPFLRVLTAAVGFAAEKDKRFFVVSLTVFALLICELLYSLYR